MDKHLYVVLTNPLNGREDEFNELYDLKRDPYELRNVVGDPGYAEIKRRLRTRLESLRDCAGKGCRSPA